MCSLRAFLGYCVDEELMERHPMTRVPTPKAPKTLPRYLTFDEVQLIIQAVDNSKGKFRVLDRALVRVLLFTGLRHSELLPMTWDDIDFGQGTLRVLGKGNQERILPLECDTLASLVDHQEASLPAGKERIWLNREGKPMNPDSLGRTIRRWMQQAKIDKDVTPHVWRHTCATLLVQNGAPLSNVQELLGHSSLATTSIYTHSGPVQSRATLSSLAGRLLQDRRGRY
jgi:integrase/recombinase XerD